LLRGCRGSPCPRGVRLQMRASLPPFGFDRVDQRPGCLDFVPAREQRRVTQQRVHDEALVSIGRIEQERGHVEEVHVHAAKTDSSRRDLGSKAKRYSLFRLDSKSDRVRLQVAGRLGTKREMRRLLEGDADLGHSFWKA